MRTQEIKEALKELHLPMMRKTFEEIIKKAIIEGLSYEEFLFRLLEEELENRKVKRIERYLIESKLNLNKSLANFDLKRVPHKPTQQIKGLLQGDFISQHENLLLFGSPGSGKTHLVQAIAQELIRKCDKKLLFAPSNRLVQQLLAAKRDLQLPKLLKKLTSYDGLIIDDIGYIQQSKEEADVLFTLLSECYERTSLLITSNLSFSKWELIFKDPMMTLAAVDRLIHHSVILEMNVKSYRKETSEAKQKEEVSEQKTEETSNQ